MGKKSETVALDGLSLTCPRGIVFGVLGPNGIGKTTFIKLIAAVEQPDGNDVPPRTEVTVSYKPQYISTDYPDTVEVLLKSVAPGLFASSQYKTEILQPFTLNRLLDRRVTKLSGGELQRVAIAADSGNGISSPLDFRRFLFINVDLTIHLGRPPEGEWICLDSTTIPDGAGAGITDTALYDQAGALGRAAQTVLVDRR